VREFVRGLALILRTSWGASPGRMTIAFGLMLLNYVSWPLAPLVLKHVTDAVVARDARSAAIAAAFLPLLAMLAQVGGHLAHVVWVEICDTNLIRVSGELGRLSQGARGLEHHERADFADRIELLRNGGNPLYMAPRTAMTSLAIVIQLAITVVMLALLQPLLLLLLVFAIPPLVGARLAWRRFEFVIWGDAENSRRATHLLELAVRADAAKEIRVFGLEDELRQRLRGSREQLRTRRFRAEFEGVALMSAGQLVFALGYVFGLLLVVRAAIRGEHTPGDVVLAVSLAAQTSELVYEVVGTTQFLQRGAQTWARLAWLRALVARLYPPERETVPVPEAVRDGIRFENVSFTYPSTHAEVLERVDLHIPAASTFAVVGENGAGKTTLVKLLCRFYDPTDGRITVDGVDIARFPYEEWRARIAAGFQDFVRFELIARESVGVGDLPAIDDAAAVGAAVERAAAADVVERLPDGIETQLGRTHADGAELSVGQWQKVALARAMMRERPLLLILDEPTSALDAHAEHELFERYAASARQVARATGGIAIFVSHRFSTVRMADWIVVVDEGRVVEQGTHAELVARGGIYAELFDLQASAYG
jgi:ATP-binding cassette subfamily B protein